MKFGLEKQIRVCVCECPREEGWWLVGGQFLSLFLQLIVLIALAEWFVRMACNLGILGLKPARALCVLPHIKYQKILVKNITF